MLVPDDKLEGFTLRETTDSRRGVQGLEKIADMGMIRQAEGEVAPEVNEVGRSHCARTLFTEIARKLFQALRDIGSHDALFLNVLGTPCQGFSLAIELVTLQFHRTSQGNRSPVRALSFQENLWCSREPASTLRCIHECDKESGIECASAIKEFHRFHPLRHLLIRTTCEDNLPEGIVLQLGMVVGEVDGVIPRKEEGGTRKEITPCLQTILLPRSSFLLPRKRILAPRQVEALRLIWAD
jgi:hypothetical protein